MNISETKKLLQSCIEHEFSLAELREYLESDLSQSPEGWMKNKSGREAKKEKQVGDYIKDRFKSWTD